MEVQIFGNIPLLRCRIRAQGRDRLLRLVLDLAILHTLLAYRWQMLDRGTPRESRLVNRGIERLCLDQGIVRLIQGGARVVDARRDGAVQAFVDGPGRNLR
jgi:hypothetical protein